MPVLAACKLLTAVVDRQLLNQFFGGKSNTLLTCNGRVCVKKCWRVRSMLSVAVLIILVDRMERSILKIMARLYNCICVDSIDCFIVFMLVVEMMFTWVEGFFKLKTVGNMFSCGVELNFQITLYEIWGRRRVKGNEVKLIGDKKCGIKVELQPFLFFLNRQTLVLTFLTRNSLLIILSFLFSAIFICSSTSKLCWFTFPRLPEKLVFGFALSMFVPFLYNPKSILFDFCIPRSFFLPASSWFSSIRQTFLKLFIDKYQKTVVN